MINNFLLLLDQLCVHDREVPEASYPDKYRCVYYAVPESRKQQFAKGDGLHNGHSTERHEDHSLRFYLRSKFKIRISILSHFSDLSFRREGALMAEATLCSRR